VTYMGEARLWSLARKIADSASSRFSIA